MVGADFFTTEVWTWRSLVTYYTLFGIDLASRRVHNLGSTWHPDEVLMRQVARMATVADDGVLVGARVLTCDRDRKWSGAVHISSTGRGVAWCARRSAHQMRACRPVRRFDQTRMPLSDYSMQRAPTSQGIDEFVEHYHRERNHQGIGNDLAFGAADGFVLEGLRVELQLRVANKADQVMSADPGQSRPAHVLHRWGDHVSCIRRQLAWRTNWSACNRVGCRQHVVQAPGNGSPRDPLQTPPDEKMPATYTAASPSCP